MAVASPEPSGPATSMVSRVKFVPKDRTLKRNLQVDAFRGHRYE